jgi:hypothetical protein
MTNNEFFTFLLQYWLPDKISFKLYAEPNPQKKIGLFRNNDHHPLYSGVDFDDIINEIRLYFSEKFIKEQAKKVELSRWLEEIKENFEKDPKNYSDGFMQAINVIERKINE